MMPDYIICLHFKGHFGLNLMSFSYVLLILLAMTRVNVLFL